MRRMMRRPTHLLRNLLVRLGALDNALDVLLHQLPLLRVTPPRRPLVIAHQSQMLACFALRGALIALLTA